MSVLTDEAAQALADMEARQAAAVDEERREFRQAALAALRVVLTRPDGTQLPVADSGLDPVEVNLAKRVVIVSDGEVTLAVQQRDDEWVVRVVEDIDGWTPVSGQVRSLADLGAALTAEGGA